MRTRVTFEVMYSKADNNGRGPGRVFSHKYSETWERTLMYCPNCGKQGVWREDSAGDYYLGEGYACLVCENLWTMQRVHSRCEQDNQRLHELRACVRAG